MKRIGIVFAAGMIPPNLPTQIAKTCSTLLVVVLFCLPVYGQPANDECVNATAFTNIPFTDNVNTTTATSNPADPSLSCNGSGAQTDGNTVWYKWTPPADITVNISTAGSTLPGGGALDTAHGVYTGTCAALTEVACVDVGLTDDLFFEATGGETYFIKFGEFLNGVGGGNLVVSVDLPPPPEQFVLESVRDGISPPISSLAQALAKRGAGDPAFEEVPMLMKDDDKPEALRKHGADMDRIIERLREKYNLMKGPETIHKFNGGPEATVEQVFDGADNDDNALQTGFFVAPPDTDGDVGPDHYVQMLNLVTEIFDKQGTSLVGPFPNNVFWTGLGGLCETTNRGDPIVLYDEETDRWFVSQFALLSSGSPPWSLCIAISTTNDPTGTYYQHEFDFSSIGFPDYPKYGFVTDAIGVMVNLFSPFQGAGLGAIDKAEAFSAGPTTMVFFTLGTNEFGFLPGDNDGPVFTGVPPTFATNNDGTGNTIDIWEIDPDFSTPTNSTISEVAQIPVSPIDGDLCPALRERCIDQPGSGTGTFPNNVTFLEAIPDRLMHRFQIRNFSDDDDDGMAAKFADDDDDDGGDDDDRDLRAVANHTVDADGNGTAGVRWYEFRNDGSGWSLHQEDTFSPDDDHRWMGSIAMNENGDILLGYSISSQQTFSTIAVAGQTEEASGSGVLNVAETIVFAGQNVQRQTSRWGDYSAMAIDPVDDTFWYTQEFALPNDLLGPPINPERFGWATKIAQISFGDDDDDVIAARAASEPARITLNENYPNPFNPTTTITFALPETSEVQLAVYDILGRQVRLLTDGVLPEGQHEVFFEAHSLASGMYLVRLITPQGTFTRTMQLVK